MRKRSTRTSSTSPSTCVVSRSEAASVQGQKDETTTSTKLDAGRGSSSNCSSCALRVGQQPQEYPSRVADQHNDAPYALPPSQDCCPTGHPIIRLELEPSPNDSCATSSAGHPLPIQRNWRSSLGSPMPRSTTPWRWVTPSRSPCNNGREGRQRLRMPQPHGNDSA